MPIPRFAVSSSFLAAQWLLLCLGFLSLSCQPTTPIANPTSSTATAAPATVTAAPAEPSKVAERKVRVAMAADLRFVAVELEREFEQRHPDIQIDPTFGSSGTLFAQISNKAPFDVYLSADIQFPQKLAEQGLGQKESLFRYAIGHIVLWVRKDSMLPVKEQGVEVLKSPDLKKLAIANPKTAPYGRAAEAALKNLGLYDGLKEKLVLGENVGQTAQFAETGAADAAIIALSLALAPEFADKGSYWEFPRDSFPTLEQGGIILEQAQDAGAAKLWCEFLRSDAAKNVFKKFGFVLPEA